MRHLRAETDSFSYLGRKEIFSAPLRMALQGKGGLSCLCGSRLIQCKNSGVNIHLKDIKWGNLWHCPKSFIIQQVIWQNEFLIFVIYVPFLSHLTDFQSINQHQALKFVARMKEMFWLFKDSRYRLDLCQNRTRCLSGAAKPFLLPVSKTCWQTIGWARLGWAHLGPPPPVTPPTLPGAS